MKKETQHTLLILVICLTQLGLLGLQTFALKKLYLQEEQAFLERLDVAMGRLYEQIDPGDVLYNQINTLATKPGLDEVSTEVQQQIQGRLHELFARLDIDTVFRIHFFNVELREQWSRLLLREAEVPEELKMRLLFQEENADPKIDYLAIAACRGCRLALGIEFPYINNWYFLGRLWNWILLSLVLLTIQIGIFVYVLRNIQKQRRLLDLKTSFINHLNHELNTPLFSISLALKHIERLDEKQQYTQLRQYLDIINSEKNRLVTTIKRSLNVTQLEQQILSVQLDEIDVAVFFDQLRNVFETHPSAASAKISTSFSPESRKLLADETLLFNALYNLIDNALKYNTEEVKRIAIDLQTLTGETTEITISDNGIGIPKAYQKKVFEKFVRLPDTSGIKGTGLGLSYVWLVIEAHGGRINLSNRAEGGSIFTITLPQPIRRADA